jgi:cell division protein FtsI/penicillin-binding protein 2
VAELLEILRIDPVVLDEALKLRQNRNVDIIDRMEPELSYIVSARISSDIALLRQQTLPTLAEQEKFLTDNTIYKCLKLTDNPVRQYPEGFSMAQVTGFVDRDGIGRLGIEGYFHDLLSGKTGKKEERRDSLGRPIFDEEEEQEVK